ncbi:MAG: hypothetical protein PHF97_10955 [Bacteroidales bacterium]|nr:hypothetical protein [Bacteroidales bacterium]
MNKTSFLLLACCIIFSSWKPPEKGTFDSADDAFNKFNPEVSLGLYRKTAFSRTATPDEQSKALEKMSYIFSRFYTNNDSALFYAFQNLNNSHHYCQASEYLLQQGKFVDAINLCRKAVELSANETDSMESCEVFAQSVLKYAEYNLQNQVPADSPLLKDAWKKLSYCYWNEPESPYINEKRLETALLLRSGNMVLQCWKEYFLVQNNDFPGSALQHAFGELEPILKDWNGQQLDRESNRKIIMAFAESRFYPLIGILSHIFPLEKTYGTDCLLAFCKYRTEIENHVYSFYRDLVFHREKKRKFQAGMKVINLTLWNVVYKDSSNLHKYTYDNFKSMLKERFGTLVYFHSKGDIHVYFGGSAVIHEDKSFEQYGFKTNFSFSLIDFIFGNRFDDWYVNRDVIIGGWNEDGECSHFRRFDLTSTARVWDDRMADPEKLSSWANETAQKSSLEEAAARKNTLTDLPGLRDRLQYRGLIALLDSLKLLQLDQRQLRVAFIIGLRGSDSRHNYMHEGRHQLDYSLRSKHYDNQDSTEYWAKLSQIAFARIPAIELSRAFIYRPDDGPRGGHTAADMRIVTEYYNWMVAHKAEITSLDDSRPILCQVDLLSDEQIRRIARSLDPLYKKSLQR